MGDRKHRGTDAMPPLTDVLLVEDNYMIALDAADMLAQLGAANVWTAANTAEALKIVGSRTLQFALLDVNLGEEKGFAIGARLNELGVPFAFATGYGDSQSFPDTYADAPVVTKPYTLDALATVIAVAMRRAGT